MDESVFPIGLIGLFVIAPFHILFLARSKNLTTHSARLRILGLCVMFPVIAVPVIAIIGLIFMYFDSSFSEDIFSMIGATIGAMGLGLLIILMIVPVFMAFSAPSRSFFCYIPLLALYIFGAPGGLGLAYCSSASVFIFLMIAWWFPWHRRLVEYTQPPKLPYLPKYRPPEKPPVFITLPQAGGPPPIPSAQQRGFTLIELLIVVLIVAIMSGAVLHATMAAYQGELFQHRREAAVSLAEDQFALLRGRDVLPEIGDHPLDEELAAKRPADAQAKISILPGPNERLREVYVTVDLEGTDGQHQVKLATIMPLRRNGGQTP